jgi:hypothetical protein
MADELPPLDLESTIVVRLEPGLAIVPLLAVAVIVVCGIVGAWALIFGGAPDDRAWLAVTFGIVIALSALLLACYAIAWALLLATASRPVLVITPAGLLDRRLSPKLIPWQAITRVGEARSPQGVPFRIGSHLGIDRNILGSLPVAWPHAPLSLDWIFPTRTLTISAVSTNIDARSLHAILSAFWKAHKDQKEPINV